MEAVPETMSTSFPEVAISRFKKKKENSRLLCLGTKSSVDSTPLPLSLVPTNSNEQNQVGQTTAAHRMSAFPHLTSCLFNFSLMADHLGKPITDSGLPLFPQ